MIIWTDDLLRQIDETVREYGYPTAASRLSDQLGEYVHPEQLRGARRRWLTRIQASGMRAATPVPVDQDMTVEAPNELFVVAQRPQNGVIRFGAVGDTHLGSKYERLDLLQELYDVYAQEGISTVYHTGNYIEGEARFNVNDIDVHGFDSQLRHFVDHYPTRDGIITYFIAGDDHEGWYRQREGVDVGQATEDMARRRGRNDLRYVGYMEADIRLHPDTDRVVRVHHPGGGSAQAVSWTSQRIVSALEHDDQLPFILLVGHYHKAEFLPNYRGIYVIQTGTFQEQSPFMRKKLLRADIGAWIVTVTLSDDDRLVRVGGEFISFPRRAWRYR